MVTGVGVSAAGAALYGPRVSRAQAAVEKQRAGRDFSSIKQPIFDLFSDLPDRKAFKIWAPESNSAAEFLIQLNAQRRMFVASTLKSVILCERLRQLDSRGIEKRLREHELPLNESIWSPGRAIFNPPDLAGRVSERTAMEAMIVHSDNTATDMVLKEAGADKVRSFIASIGLKKTMIPDSTRVFGAYLAGARNYKTITWSELISLPQGPLAHPFLNNVETLASSAEDLVSFFSRALQGSFFSHRETLFQFKRILQLGDINYLVPFPLGFSALGKAGYADVPGSHARSIAGGVYFPNRWVYFSMVLNWDAAAGEDPTTERAFYGAIRKSIVLLQRHLRD